MKFIVFIIIHLRTCDLLLVQEKIRDTSVIQLYLHILQTPLYLFFTRVITHVLLHGILV